jgi:hypothetical protein
MMPTEPVIEMMRRTLFNLKFVECHKTDAGPYEVTQLVNSFLAGLAHPWEKLRDDLNQKTLAQAAQMGWPVLHKELEKDIEPANLGEQIALVRHAFAHGNVEFLPGPNGEIGGVRFWNKKNGVRTWGSTATVADLRAFLQCFVEFAEQLRERTVGQDSTLAMETSCWHVARDDDPFKARMRFHQSWYRRHIVGLPPGSRRGELYGNLLRPADGVAGRNFLSPAIHEWVEDRVQENRRGLEPNRLRNNLLSSQPFCFNLFAPLALDLELATRLVNSLPGLPDGLRVTQVACEFAPSPAHHLRDRTAFDAWIEYARPDGRLGFVGIETKLTEPFSNKSYTFDHRYARWQVHPSWWWQPGAEASFADPSINQLWRNHLLAFAMLHQSDSRYAEGYCAVLYHDEDTACATSITAYRSYVQSAATDTLLEWPLHDVISQWETCAATNAEQQWLRAFRMRYLDLEASQPAWVAFQEHAS